MITDQNQMMTTLFFGQQLQQNNASMLLKSDMAELKDAVEEIELMWKSEFSADDIAVKLISVIKLLKKVREKSQNAVCLITLCSEYVGLVADLSEVCVHYLEISEKIIKLREIIITHGFKLVSVIPVVSFDLKSMEYKAFEYFVKAGRIDPYNFEYNEYKTEELDDAYLQNKTVFLDLYDDYRTSLQCNFNALKSHQFSSYLSKNFQSKYSLLKKLKKL